MKKTLLILSLLLTPQIILAETKDSKESIYRIGATLPLSGKLASIGESFQRGLEVSIAEINAKGLAGDVIIELTTEDNAGEPKNAVSSVQKLIEQDKVNFLYSATTHISTAVAPIAAAKQLPFLYSSTIRTIAESNAFFFRDYFDAEDGGQKIANTMVRSGSKKISILSETSDACALYIKALRATATGKLEILSEESYSPGETDFKPLLLKIKAKAPDSLALCTWRDTSLVAKQMKELNLLKIRTFHWVGPFLESGDTQEVRRILEENRAISTWYALPSDEVSPKRKAFETEYEKNYGQHARPDAAYAYDDMKMLAQALKVCTSANLNPECVTSELRKVTHEGVAGPVSFNEKGVSQRPVFLIQVTEGEWKRVVE